MKLRLILLFAVFLSKIAFAQDSLRITNCGTVLKTFYHNLDVVNKWQSGQHIDWETGLPDNPNAKTGVRTHCSAFVAAACERQNVYILRPPEHRQELLANAQFDWLNSSQSKRYGWHRIKGNALYEAQNLANNGFFVVVCAQNPDRHKPGHIAMVMPFDLSLGQLQKTGPVLIQASGKNSENALFRTAFRHHIEDWSRPTEDVLFYYNEQKINCTP